MKKVDAITIGDCTVDTFLIISKASLEKDLEHDEVKLCFKYGDKVPIESTHQAVGGNAANVAIGLLKQGYETAIRTEIGDDINGHVIKKKLEQIGVNTGLVKVLEGKNSRYSMILQYESDRTILSSYADREYTLGELSEADLIYYTSLGSSFESLQDELINFIQSHPQTTFACNPGTYQMKKRLEKLKEVLPYTDILFVNREEAERITKLDNESTIETIYQHLFDLGVETAIITAGSEGAFVSDQNKIYKMKPYPIEPVGKTGAGDAFASGFLGAKLEGADEKTALKWGTANATGVVQEIGAHEGVLNKKEIKELINRFPEVKPEEV